MHCLVQGGGREEREGGDSLHASLGSGRREGGEEGRRFIACIAWFKVPSIVLISIRPEAHIHLVLIKVYVTSDLN